MTHYVILEEPDPDGRPQKRLCECALGTDHFFDAELKAATHGARLDPLVIYRDDATVCLQVRFGQAHERHIYSYMTREARGVGFYECEGLPEEQAGHPFPARPYLRTGLVLDDLADDLVDWWHTYATTETWGPSGTVLPLGLDAAARQFVTHATSVIKREIERRFVDERVQKPLETIEQVAERATTVDIVVPVARSVSRPIRRWPISSVEPAVPIGFTVTPDWEHQERRADQLRYEKIKPYRWKALGSTANGVEGGWGSINGSQAENGGTPVVEVLTSTPRVWPVGSAEPEMPPGFHVRDAERRQIFKRVDTTGPARWLRLGDRLPPHTWGEINGAGPGNHRLDLVEVMPGETFTLPLGVR